MADKRNPRPTPRGRPDAATIENDENRPTLQRPLFRPNLFQGWGPKL